MKTMVRTQICSPRQADHLLTLAYFVFAGWGVWEFRALLPEALVCLAAVAALAAAVRRLESVGCGRRVQDQVLQLVVHATMTAAGSLILLDPAGEGRAWWSWTAEEGLSLRGCWTPDPSVQSPSWTCAVLLLAQFVVWAYMGLSCRFLEERSHDYAVMMTHHVVTVLLIVLARSGGNWRAGLICMLIHDASDVLVDLMKLAHYLRLGGPAMCYTTEVLWALTMVAWVLCRNIVFPIFWWTNTVEQYQVRIVDRKVEAGLGLPWWGFVARHWHSPYLPYYPESMLLLGLLACMHVYWGLLLARIGFRAVCIERGARTSAVGTEMYDRIN